MSSNVSYNKNISYSQCILAAAAMIYFTQIIIKQQTTGQSLLIHNYYKSHIDD